MFPFQGENIQAHGGQSNTAPSPSSTILPDVGSWKPTIDLLTSRRNETEDMLSEGRGSRLLIHPTQKLYQDQGLALLQKNRQRSQPQTEAILIRPLAGDLCRSGKTNSLPGQPHRQWGESEVPRKHAQTTTSQWTSVLRPKAKKRLMILFVICQAILPQFTLWSPMRLWSFMILTSSPQRCGDGHRWSITSIVTISGQSSILSYHRFFLPMFT